MAILGVILRLDKRPPGGLVWPRQILTLRWLAPILLFYLAIQNRATFSKHVPISSSYW